MSKFTDNDMNNYCLIKSKEGVKPCFICKEPTEYIEYCCEGRLCSTECHDNFYKEVMATEV